jgi:DNA-binding GntR family transcriptional regulator
MLEMEGLVHIDRSGSAVVAPLDADLIRDLYGFREGVERYVAESLAKRNDQSWTPLRELLGAGRKASTGDDQALLIDLDLKFHVALYDALGNRILSDVMRGQWNNMRRVMSATLAISGYSRLIWDEHTAILDAIMQHDPDRAGSLASAHTRAASTRLLERLGAGTSEPPPTPAAITRENHFGPE